MSKTFSYLYYQKKPKNYTTGQIPIYCRITVEGQRAELSTGYSCDPAKWNSSGGKPLGSGEEAKNLTKALDGITRKIYDACDRLNTSNIHITALKLKEEYQGKSDKLRSLVLVFQDHNNKMKALIGKKYAQGTLDRFETTLKHIIEFLQLKYNCKDYDVRSVDLAFITDFEFFLRTVRHCANNATIKYVRNFQKIIKICLANEWITKNPFMHFDGKVIETDRVFLSKEELNLITTKAMATSRLSQVRDIFVFSCYTGLAYADVKKLDRSQIGIGVDGGKWIFTHRQKTDTAANIPILPEAAAILEKYANDPQCRITGKILPVLSNQKMNAYLKEIAAVSGVEKEITFHTARHTFATTVTLTNGVPIESVSKMLGHRDIKTTQHYAKVLDSKVGNDMAALRQRMQQNSAPPQMQVAN